MNILLVDDEPIILNGGVRALRTAAPNDSVTGFTDAGAAMDFVRAQGADAAFLDVDLHTASGLALAEEMRRASPGIRIIYVTAYHQYMERAWEQHVNGYVLKPLTEEKARRELAWLRGAPPAGTGPLVRVQTFGNFEIYHNDMPLPFLYRKTKELVAYLVDRRGAMCAQNEIIGALWDDDDPRSHVSYFYNLRKDLQDTLEREGIGEILVRRRGVYGIVPSLTDCDYYRLLDGDPAARALYQGEYMCQYSWAEVTHGALEARFSGLGV